MIPFVNLSLEPNYTFGLKGLSSLKAFDIFIGDLNSLDLIKNNIIRKNVTSYMFLPTSY